MEHDAPIPNNKKEKLTKNRKSESAKADPEGLEITYGIDHLTIG